MKKIVKRPSKKADKKKINRPDIFLSVCNFVHFALLILSVWIMVAFTCTYLAPVITASIAGGAGITYESNYIDVFALMILPSLFALALLFVAEVSAIKWWNNKLKQVFDEMLKKHTEKVAEKSDV